MTPMQSQTTLRAILLALATSTPLLSAAGPGASNDFGGKRVLIIGIDGMRSDALRAADAPNIAALSAQGVTTYNAIAGGILGTPTQQPTISGPGWCSITIGVWTDKHKIVDNDFSPYTAAVASDYPHFFQRLKAAKPNSYLSSIVSWGPIEDQIVGKVASSVNYHVKATGADYPARDLDVTNKAVSHLGATNPDVLFLHFDQVDGAGHSSGFTPANPAYLSAIHTVDTHIGSVLAAINARPQIAQEKWLVILTTDHGGNNGHGGQSSEERNIPFIVSGSVVNAPQVSSATPGQTAVPPTAMKYLGVPVNAAWGWASPDFGLPPYFFAPVSGSNVNLSWTLPAAGLSGLTGYEIRRDGAVIATPALGTTTYTDTPAIGSHVYEIRFLGTSETRTGTAAVAGELNDQLVLHLPFDGNAQDVSGKAHNGTINGTPVYTTGKSGQSLQFTDTASPHQYVNLGQPTDLQFGATDSFTVSVWVNHTGNFPDNRSIGGSADDPAILSNKDWNTGGNTGWFLGAGSDGRWQWNVGDGSDRADYDSAGSLISDGQWHHLCVVHDRTTNEARLFYDGALAATRSLTTIDSLNSAKPTAVATDGALGAVWPGFFNGKIDEVKIWRRPLLNSEVNTVYQNLNEGLVLHLPLNGTTQDTSGRGNNGTVNGSPSYTAGRRGQCLQFTDTASPHQFLNLGQPNDLKFNATDSFTVSVWVNHTGNFPDNRSTGGSADDPAILSNKDWNNGTNTGWLISAGSNGRWQWNAGDGADRSDYDSAGSLLSDGQWHHLCVVHDRTTNEARLYYDGVLSATRSLTAIGSLDAGKPTAVATDGTLGTVWSNWFTGKIDDVKIWRRPLATSEVTSVFQN